jgi:ketosteroid isomerase-like protein
MRVCSFVDGEKAHLRPPAHPIARGLSVPHVSNLETIQELYGAFGRGEIEPVLAALAPDVEWVEGDIDGLPYGGVHHGPEAVGRDVFAQMPNAYDSFELVPREWVDGGDTIVMLGRVTVCLDGRESTQSVAQVWKFEDGRITRFESFQDTLATARVLGAIAD